MSDIQFRSDMSVDLVDHMGGDHSVVRAARVSTQTDSNVEDGEGLIRYLMRSRHGSPFEHNAFTFRVEAPIFVWREFMRHRIGFSYNEESGRYTQLKPVFYVPDETRKLVQIGKPGHYEFVEGSDGQLIDVQCGLRNSATRDYMRYTRLLTQGVAREVARMCLPVNIYSSAYVTCNARSLMSFLSLRTKRDGAAFPSFPQREIEMVAEQLEAIWAEHMPITAEAFTHYGRVSP